jgi:6-phosphogluconate dehydrogenase
MIFIIMGVSGSGKTTVGIQLASALGLPFYDADDHHPETNVNKMSEGIPLTDSDRQRWLEQLAADMRQWEVGGGAVVACSALKESYRKILQPPGSVTPYTWIYLEGSPALIKERLAARKGHFMPPVLLDSQFEALEKPNYGLHLNVAQPPEEIVRQIIKKVEDMNPLSEFGLIGLGVMGSSLALNLAGKGVPVAMYNRHVAGKEEGVARKVIEANSDIGSMAGFDDLREFIQSLKRPRKILLMIAAGAVDYQLDELLPLLEEGDVLIDGGNSFFKDTARRARLGAEKGVHFIGAGISGGEEGARKGPSIMPGGSPDGYKQVEPYLELLAAKDKNGQPCTTYIGQEGAGHFVKMVHNGIEYAEMQLLAETYALLRFYLGCAPEEIVQHFTQWQEEGLRSYLLEITIDILQKKEGDALLLDKILDQAEQKGTGGWSAGAALEYGVPYSPLTEAVMARALSAMKKSRVKAAALYEQNKQEAGKQKPANRTAFIAALKGAYQATRIINHQIGFSLMKEVSKEEGWELNFSEIARIWTNGCIIRSELMEELSEIYKAQEELLSAPSIVSRMQDYRQGFAYVAAEGLQAGVALPVLSAALNYFLGYITANSPANLLQAQRDYFGAHTYRRIDKPGDAYFHTQW